ncbi:MAG TPA: glycosyltransferase family 9 protein, partial [Bacteroidia bacterium]|nr:glycosyltransferase family 9 protein [Bacteroidia bacterium]
GLADRVRPLEDPRLATFFAPGAKLDPEWCAYFAGFDVVVSCLYDPDGHFAGNLRVAGVKTLIPCPYRPDETPPHVPAAVQFAKPLESLGLFLDEAGLDLAYASSPDVSDFGSGPLIALHPGSGSPRKNWGYENWIAVLLELHRERPELRFLVTSGEAEAGTIGDFLDLMERSALPYEHFAGRPLAELGAIYRRVEGFLGHDSGLSHLAASAGAKGLLLFGPTEPGIWAPVSSKVEVIRSSDRSLGGIPVRDVVEVACKLFTAS